MTVLAAGFAPLKAGDARRGNRLHRAGIGATVLAHRLQAVAGWLRSRRVRRAALLAIPIMALAATASPVPGDPRPLRRRNEILTLMARNGYISESLARRCQGEPVRVAAQSSVKTDAPAAIENVFDELSEHGGGGRDAGPAPGGRRRAPARVVPQRRLLPAARAVRIFVGRGTFSILVRNASLSLIPGQSPLPKGT